MTEPPETPATTVLQETPSPSPRERTAQSERAARLAKALRENLRRRKAPRPVRTPDS